MALIATLSSDTLPDLPNSQVEIERIVVQVSSDLLLLSNPPKKPAPMVSIFGKAYTFKAERKAAQPIPVPLNWSVPLSELPAGETIIDQCYAWLKANATNLTETKDAPPEKLVAEDDKLPAGTVPYKTKE